GGRGAGRPPGPGGAPGGGRAASGPAGAAARGRRPPADIAAPGPQPEGGAQSRSVAAYGASVAEPAPQPSAGAGSVYEGFPVSWYYVTAEIDSTRDPPARLADHAISSEPPLLEQVAGTRGEQLLDRYVALDEALLARVAEEGLQRRPVAG